MKRLLGLLELVIAVAFIAVLCLFGSESIEVEE